MKDSHDATCEQRADTSADIAEGLVPSASMMSPWHDCHRSPTPPIDISTDLGGVDLPF
jgi:hypothetical protein